MPQLKSKLAKILAIGQKLFEEKTRAIGFSIKRIGSEGVTAEMSITSEIKGFGPAKGVEGKNMGTMKDLRGPSGIGGGTGQGIITTNDGDMIIWKMMYSRKTAGKEKYVGVMTFMTMSKKLAWLNNIICATEGEGSPDITQGGINTIYEWIP